MQKEIICSQGYWNVCICEAGSLRDNRLVPRATSVASRSTTVNRAAICATVWMGMMGDEPADRE